MMMSIRRRRSRLVFVGVSLVAACSADTDGAAEPWTGSLAAGLDQMESLATEGAYDGALAVADRMQVPDAFSRSRAWLERVTGGASESALRPVSRALDALGFDALKDADRAEIEYARAVVLLAAVAGEAAANSGDAPADASGRLQRAIDSFDRVRAAGGPARLDAVYDLGSLDLAAAEVIRATIPEISGGPPPPPQGSAMAADKDDEDPLDLARRGYLAAREHLVERLLLAPDADTRANAELVTRRLRELDEIEQQREEQQKEQDQQKQPDDSESKDQEGDPKDQDPSDESKPEDEGDESQDPPDDAPPDDQEKPEDQEDAEAPEDEDEESDAESEPEEAEPEKPEERLMTEEERKRVMERNREYQENGEALKRILRMRRKIPAKRDW